MNECYDKLIAFAAKIDYLKEELRQIKTACAADRNNGERAGEALAYLTAAAGRLRCAIPQKESEPRDPHERLS